MVTRFINRGANPFAPLAKQKNQSFVTPRNGIYEKLSDRVYVLLNDHDSSEIIMNAIGILQERLKGQTYKQEHFGYLALVETGLIDINIDIQRDLLAKHIGKDIIAKFDPRILQPINVTYIKETGRYSAWDGQQSAATLKLLMLANIVDPEVKVQCKVVDNDLRVPGSDLVGEASGNLGFRLLNNSREPVDAFWMHRSRVSGVRNYGSTMQEDLQANEIQLIFEANNMYPAKAKEGTGRNAQPGMVTYISGCNNIAGHGTSDENFAMTKEDLNSALRWHDTYFAHEKGVDGGFILAFGRLYAEAREKDIAITKDTEQDLFQMFKHKYGSPAGFHRDCKNRLTQFQTRNNLKSSWSDSCLTPILVMDYLNWSKSKNYPLPAVNHMTTYAGI